MLKASRRHWLGHQQSKLFNRMSKSKRFGKKKKRDIVVLYPYIYLPNYCPHPATYLLIRVPCRAAPFTKYIPYTIPLTKRFLPLHAKKK